MVMMSQTLWPQVKLQVAGLSLTNLGLHLENRTLLHLEV